jgi:hypothetical protein
MELEAQTRVQRQDGFIDNFNINETYKQTNTQYLDEKLST